MSWSTSARPLVEGWSPPSGLSASSPRICLMSTSSLPWCQASPAWALNLLVRSPAFATGACVGRAGTGPGFPEAPVPAGGSFDDSGTGQHASSRGGVPRLPVAASGPRAHASFAPMHTAPAAPSCSGLHYSGGRTHRSRRCSPPGLIGSLSALRLLLLALVDARPPTRTPQEICHDSLQAVRDVGLQRPPGCRRATPPCNQLCSRNA